MRKFFKMGLAICLLLVMLFSLVACSGGRSSDKTGGETESGDISSTDVGNNGDEDVGFGDADDTDSAETDANGMYIYHIYRCEVHCPVDVEKYISDSDGYQAFDFIRMAKDLGYEPYPLDKVPAVAELTLSSSEKISFQIAPSGRSGDYECLDELIAKYHKDGQEARILANFAVHDFEMADYRLAGRTAKRMSYATIVLTAYTLSKAKLETVNFEVDPGFNDVFDYDGSRYSIR